MMMKMEIDKVTAQTKYTIYIIYKNSIQCTKQKWLIQFLRIHKTQLPYDSSEDTVCYVLRQIIILINYAEKF